MPLASTRPLTMRFDSRLRTRINLAHLAVLLSLAHGLDAGRADAGDDLHVVVRLDDGVRSARPAARRRAPGRLACCGVLRRAGDIEHNRHDFARLAVHHERHVDAARPLNGTCPLDRRSIRSDGPTADNSGQLDALARTLSMTLLPNRPDISRRRACSAPPSIFAT